MFLDVLKRRNPDFIRAATALHQAGDIPANCYLLDLDTLRLNAGIIKAKADAAGMKTYPMTKQIGREPAAVRALIEEGLPSFVTVDIQDARAVVAAGGGLGHTGHLVQIAAGDTPWTAAQNPEWWTAFSMNQVRRIAAVSAAAGRTQNILARIQAPGDVFYRGHEGGFDATDIASIADSIDALEGVHFAGITSFPCLLFDNEKRGVFPTPNLETLEKALAVLDGTGRGKLEVNTPGTTSAEVIRLFAAAGSTQVEPGHGLTGTTPLHAVRDLPEDPAVLYVSEISHHHGSEPFCYGGGLYIDPVFPPYGVKCLTGQDPELILKRESSIEFPADNAIDYYGILHPDKGLKAECGDTVIMGFRPQIFVTRGYVAGVSGISRGTPVVEGISFADGRRVEWP